MPLSQKMKEKLYALASSKVQISYLGVKLASLANQDAAHQKRETSRKITSDKNDGQTTQINVPTAMKQQTAEVAKVDNPNNFGKKGSSPRKDDFLMENPEVKLGPVGKEPSSSPSSTLL